MNTPLPARKLPEEDSLTLKREGTGWTLADTTVPHPVRQRVVLSLHVDEHRCLSCAGCISVCPRMAVPISRLNSLAEGILCRGCGLCVQVCPVEALSQIPIALAEPPSVPDDGERRRAAREFVPATTEPQ